MYAVTILTPSFNRARFLTKVYDSLLKQTKSNFQWLVVDDGSSDNTEEVMRDIQNKDHSFDVTYVKKENGGKHTALNHAHPYIKGTYTMVLDSDDAVSANCIERICKVIEENVTSQNIGWLAFLKGVAIDSTEDPFYRENLEVTNYIEYMNRGRKGEAADVYLSEVFKKYPYPEIPGEKFVSESYLNIQAAVYGNYNMLTVNEIIQIVEYQVGGLTDEGRRLQLLSPKGHADLWKHVYKQPFSLKMRLKGTWLYIAYSLFAKESFINIIRNSKCRWRTALNLPLGYMIYLIWKRKYMSEKE